MAARMSPGEKLQYYFHRLSTFELKKGWSFGKYTVSEYLFLLLIGIWLAYFLPALFSLDTLLGWAEALSAVYLIYLVLLFILWADWGAWWMSFSRVAFPDSP